MAVSIGPKIGIDGEREYKKALKEIIQETKTLDAQIKSAGSSFDEEASAIDKNKKQTDLLLEKKKKLKQELDLMKEQLKKLQQSDGDTTVAEAKLKEQMAKVETQIGKTNDAIEKLGDSTDETAKDVDKSADAVDAMANVLISSGLAAKVEDITKALMDCVNAADEFEVGMTKLSTVADTAAVDMATLEEQVLEASTSLGVSATDIAEAAYQAISASVDTAESVKFVETATKLAEAGFTDAATATDVLTTAINAYGLATEDAEHVADVLVTTQNLGKTSVNELAQTMGQVIPIAQTYGVSVENLASAYVELTKNGINTAASTTDLKAMLSELGDSSKEVSKVLVDQTGKAFSELMAEGKSLGDVIDILSDSVGNDKNKFAELWASSRTSGVAALTLLKNGSKEYNQVLEDMGRSAGTVNTAFNKVSSTSAYAGRRLETSVQNLQIAIGKRLSPVLTEAEKGLTNIVEAFTKWIDENPQIVSLIAALTTGLAVMVGGFAAYVAITKIAKVVTEQLTEAMAKNPFGMVALAITAVITALTTFVALSSAAADGQETVAEKARNASQALAESQSALADSTSETASSLSDSIGSAVESANLAGHAADELLALADKSEKTAEEQERMAVLVQELNTLFPEMNLQIDEQTGALSMTNEEIVKYIENMKNMALAEAYNRAAAASYDALVSATADLNEARKEEEKLESELTVLRTKRAKFIADEQIRMINLEKATNDYNDALARGEKDLSKYTEAINKYSSDQVTYNGRLMTTADAVEQITTEITDCEEAHKDLEKGVKSAQDAVTDATEQANSYTEQYVEASKSVEAMTVAEENLDEATNELTEDQQDLLNLIESVMEGVASSVADNAAKSISWFEALGEQTAISTETLAQNLANQIAAMETWQQNLAYLADTGINKNLLQYLADLGPKGAAYVQAFVDAANGTSEVGLDQLNALWEQKLNLSDPANENAQKVASAVAEGVAEAQGALDESAGAVSEAAKEIVKNTGNMEKDAVDDVKGMTDKAKSTINTFANDATSEIRTLYQNLSAEFDKIKGLTNFTWSLPYLAMPHFSLTGKFDLEKNQVPNVSVQWYRQGYDSAIMLNSPTIFGRSGNTLLGGGDGNGTEIVVGERHLLDMMTRTFQMAMGQGVTNNYAGASVNVNVYGQAGQDVNQLADLVANKIDRQIKVRQRW